MVSFQPTSLDELSRASSHSRCSRRKQHAKYALVGLVLLGLTTFGLCLAGHPHVHARSQEFTRAWELKNNHKKTESAAAVSIYGHPIFIGDVVQCKNGTGSWAQGTVTSGSPLKINKTLAFDECQSLEESSQASENKAPQHQQTCSSQHESCVSTRCCIDEGYICFEKDQWWAGCRKNCTVGSPEPGVEKKYQDPWSCHIYKSENQGLEMCDCDLSTCRGGDNLRCEWSEEHGEARCGTGQFITAERKCIGWFVV